MHKANIPPIATAIGVLGFIAALVFAGMQLQRNRSNEDAQVNVSTNTGRTEELAARFGGEVTYVDSNGIRLRLVEAGLAISAGHTADLRNPGDGRRPGIPWLPGPFVQSLRPAKW